jgi:predicted acyltransferase
LATALLGLLTGVWLRTSRTLAQKAQGIAIAGISCVLLGGLWNLSFPINKKLWTSSFVLFAGGLSLLLLALAIWIVDVRSAKQSSSNGSKPWSLFSPLLVFGTNAITAYVFSELLASALDHIHMSSGANLQQTLYQIIHGIVPDAAFASLLYSLGYVFVCWLVVYPLYRQKIFIKI